MDVMINNDENLAVLTLFTIKIGNNDAPMTELYRNYLKIIPPDVRVVKYFIELLTIDRDLPEGHIFDH